MNEQDAQKWLEDLMEMLPGFEEKYDSINAPEQLDEATVSLLNVITVICGGEHAMVKGAYILGAYNQERGLHDTKH